MLAQENDYLNRAYEKLQEISADEQKRLEYDAREKDIRDFEWQIYKSREAGFKDGIQNGRATAICDLLEELAPVSDELKKTIFSEKKSDILKKWLSLAAKAESIEQFEHTIKNM